MQSVMLIVPGRKTDIKDAQWLCQLMEAGLLRASFVPPKPIRTLRNLTRYRKTQIHDRSREAARLHKMLEDAGIKLATASRPTSWASPGETCSTHSCHGTTDPVLLADLARGVLRKKIPALREALEGRFDSRTLADRRPRSWRTSTSSTNRSPGSQTRSSNGSSRSRASANC